MERTILQHKGNDRLGQLLERYQSTGEDAAIDELVARTRPRLLAIARRIAGGTAAEDAVQAAYLALLSQKRPAGEVRVEAWLTATTIRRAYRQRATERRQVDLAQKLGSPAVDGDPSLLAARSEEGAVIAGEVERLPARYRDPIVLHYLHGLSAAEVAQLLDLPRGTVTVRVAWLTRPWRPVRTVAHERRCDGRTANKWLVPARTAAHRRGKPCLSSWQRGYAAPRLAASPPATRSASETS